MGHSVLVEFELKVMNYKASPPGSNFNPAGFMHEIEIDGLPEGSRLVNSNDANPILPLD